MTSKPAVDVEALVDGSRIGGLHLLIVALGAGVLAVDGFDTQVVGYVAPQIAKSWAVSHLLLGAVFGSAQFGVLVGNLALSPLAGRIGPKRLVVLSLGAVGLFMLLSAAAGSVEALIAWRFMAGLGLGGSLPGAVALTGEFWPRRRRATAVTLTYFGFSLGQIAAGAVTNLLLASGGWRAVLWVGAALPFALMALLQAALPESLEFLIHAGRRRDQVLRLLRRLAPQAALGEDARLVSGAKGRRAVAVGELFRARRLVGTLAIWTVMFMILTANYFVQNWLTTMLIGLGLAQPAAVTATTMSMWGGLPTSFVVGPLMDRFGGYRVIVSLFLTAVLGFLLLGWLMRPPLAVPLIMAATLVVGFCISGGQRSLSALAVQFYPAALRSTGIGWAFGVGRAGAVLGPVAVGALLQLGWSASSLYFLAALVPLAAAASGIAMARYYAAPAPAGPGGRDR